MKHEEKEAEMDELTFVKDRQQHVFLWTGCESSTMVSGRDVEAMENDAHRVRFPPASSPYFQ